MALIQDVQQHLHFAVIGGGSAGLAMCRHLAARPEKFSVVLYEQTSSVGGTWVYSDRTELDENGLPLHSSMYKNLRTILPKENMAYLDFPFPSGGSSYVPRAEVLQYLNDYCDHFNLRPLIKFLTRVINVSPLSTEKSGKKWRVETEHVVTKEKYSEDFDAVAVCNGHYFLPKYTEIVNLEKFTGAVMHSHDFRDPEIFVGKNVLCLGAGASGLDISLQALDVAKQLALSYEPPHDSTASFPDSIKILPLVKSADTNGFYFENGEFFPTDVVVFCTGYHFAFPFLSRDCGIFVRQRRVLNLYKHLINIKHPTMSILSVPLFTLPFPLSDVQAQYVIKTLTHPEILPSESEMQADTQVEMETLLKGGYSPRFFHRLGHQMWTYVEELIELGGLPITIPPWRKELHRISFNNRMLKFSTFRQLTYTVNGNDVSCQ